MPDADMAERQVKKWGLNFLHMFCKDGTYKEAVEIVDYGNKKSLGMFEITNKTQYLVSDPPDMLSVKGIYKECFNILENSK